MQLFLVIALILSLSTSLACPPGYSCPVDISNLTAYMVASYSFLPEARLSDSTGLTGDLQPSVSIPSYSTANTVTDGPYIGAEAAVFTGANYYNATPPPLKQCDMGFSISLWFYSTTTGAAGNTGIWGMAYDIGLEPLLELIIISGSLRWHAKTTSSSGADYIITEQNFFVNTWYHIVLTTVCETQLYVTYGQRIYAYVNGVQTDTSFVGYYIRFDALRYMFLGKSPRDVTYLNFEGKIADVRIFNKMLDLAEIQRLYKYTAAPCPAGTFSALPFQQSCTPCPPTYYQPNPGQILCIKCQYGTHNWYGAVLCASTTSKIRTAQTWATASTTPGTATLAVGSNYLSFFCPSGTYSNTVPTPLTRITDALNCQTGFPDYTTCPSSGCCIYVSPVAKSIPDRFLDGSSLTSTWTGTNANSAYPYIAINFGSQQYVHSIIIFERETPPSRATNLYFYVGDVLVTAPSYPQNDYSNALCEQWSGSSALEGYRSPMNIVCKRTGQYLYIMMKSTSGNVQLAEIIILGSPACNECPSGTYSEGTQPTLSCTKCAPGTYQPSNYASACLSCPAGTIQPEPGQTFCYTPAPAGSYNAFRTEDNLVHHYTFPTSNPYANNIPGDNNGLQDRTVSTLSFQSSCRYTGDTCVSMIDSILQNNATVNLASLVSTTGFTVSFWYKSDVDTTGSLWYIPLLIGTSSNPRQLEFKRHNTNANGRMTVYMAGGSVLSLGTGTGSSTDWHFYSFSLLNNNAYVRMDGTWTTSTYTYSTIPNTNMYIYIGGHPFQTTYPRWNGKIQDVAFYKTILNQAQTQYLYDYKTILPCPIGSFQDQVGEYTCKPCGIGTYQSSTGATVCTACSPATAAPYYGSTVCTSALQAKNVLPTTTQTGTPGKAMLTTGSNYIAFNCPSGTYSSGVFNIQNILKGALFASLANAYTCSTADLCIFPSSELTPNIASYAVDGIYDTNKLQINTAANKLQYVGIILSKFIYIDTVTIFQDNTDAFLQDFMVFSGSTSVGNRKPVTTTPPVYNPDTNTLCYKDPGNTNNYKNPLVFRCNNVISRYLYIVGNYESGGLSISEIIITNTTVCNLCNPGTYSYNSVPTTRCSPCPAGTYQSGLGMSFCDACASGTYQSGVGMTSAERCVSVSTSLQAFYEFNPRDYLASSAGTFGSLTQNAVEIRLIPGPFFNSFAVSSTAAQSITSPGYNYYTWLSSTGFSICFYVQWTNVVDFSSPFVFNAGTAAYFQYSMVNSDKSSIAFMTLKDGAYNTYLLTPQAAPVVLNVWRHVCITLKGASTTMKYYENGVLLKTTTGMTVLGTNTFSARFAYYMGSPVTSLRIYNKELTDTEVSQIYKFQNNEFITESYCRASTYCTYCKNLAIPNLIMYYSFWTDNRVLDNSFVSGNLAITGTVSYTPNAFWPGGEAITLSPGNYLTLPAITVDFAQMSVCVWAAPVSTTTTEAYVFQLQATSPTAAHLALVWSRSQYPYISYRYNTVYQNVSLRNVKGATPVHICIVINNQVVMPYEGGIFAKLVQTHTGYTADAQNYLGKGQSTGTYTGDIDEFRVYNRALTEVEVQNIYNFRNKPCPPGSYCPIGTYDPVACPKSTYSNSFGATACTLCPSGQYTVSVGASSVSACQSC